MTDWFIDSDILPNPKFPIIFENTFGNCMESSEFSCFNREDIAVVVFYVKRILNGRWNGRVIQPQEIGICTPYRLQANMIKDAISGEGYEKVSVGTAEIFQRQERSIMIISTVQTDRLGFVKDPKVNFPKVTKLFILYFFYFLLCN